MSQALRALLLLALIALGSSSAFAARPNTLDVVTVYSDRSCNVEQQTIRWYGSFNPIAPCPGSNVVNNPTGCGWDIDDSWTMRGEGRIETGQVVRASFCVVSDGSHRAPVDAAVRAKHDRLIVWLDGSDGRSWPAVPVRDGSEWAYYACGDNFISNYPVPHPEIPGSNGGHGTLVIYTLTIDATARGGNVVAALDYGQGIWTVGGCA